MSMVSGVIGTGDDSDAAASLLRTIVENPTNYALFFDVDGTLIDIALSPDAVEVPPDLPDALRRLSRRYGDALALLSGRSIPWLDGRFENAVVSVGGLHGLERRDAGGVLRRITAPPMLEAARATIMAALDDMTGVLVEDKDLSIALHYRAAPEQRLRVKRLLTRLAEASDGLLDVMPGKAVVELRTTGAHKGSALMAFMREDPFAGRLPVFFGDDRTDEDAFAAAREKGGVAVVIGRPAEEAGANLSLPDPASVRNFIALAGAENLEPVGVIA
ncbi:trehalose-phosphatase [Chelatococcus asaccharovorans]|uniref:Trehalose 6-phosphate phosphatase n=1 Tax=Chelatococcus asaccharovorans TaxID=28210 RepID=A0A2V3UIU4_9HYPH|nr:trehalose-phosphatase [Chelatococcus asaccharovorans]MBS7705907.1 trehalose-phosphatase [Chelatococcus asaccharovorans]PXW58928.1 trehalose 6-phosphatase [Chelatococcus asaccharovorans]CAH1658748.1 putative trehalose-phosphate phosphatase [Chelatococcus asaccharovorans]CAH1684415.1 putative trehalose-phosphate phosphatase [Chelatococcus asaccharovorans]